jgi:hypothetical protein
VSSDFEISYISAKKIGGLNRTFPFFGWGARTLDNYHQSNFWRTGDQKIATVELLPL